MIDCAELSDDVADLFHVLDAELRGAFESVGKGRAVATLVDATAEATPVVRTTGVYATPAVVFTPTIRKLSDRVKALIEREQQAQVPAFNNVMCEMYETSYRKMGFHSDQALDLAPGSWIAILSAYDSPAAALRKLVIEDKSDTDSSTQREIVMRPNSVLFFSLESNAVLRHKIVLARNDVPGSGRWLGITMRTSKLWVSLSSVQLRLATSAERAEFLRLRSQENRTAGVFEWPQIDFTISPSDLLTPAELSPAQSASTSAPCSPPN